jgi:TfoX/Sxy family transcriptional regulator of competence genes
MDRTDSNTGEIPRLAERVRRALTHAPLEERRMFGGITFLLNGNMLCCVSKHGLMARVGKSAETDALARPFATRCLGAGRPMAGFIRVAPEGIADDRALAGWLRMALAYVEPLPPKQPKKRSPFPIGS